MKIFLFSIILYVFFACNQQNKPNPSSIPWLHDSISKELHVKLPLDALTVLYKFQLDSIHPAIVATVKIDQLNGGIFIYQWVNGQYKLQYRKPEPVYNVQYNNNRYLVFESGFTGTGQKNTRFYLLELSPYYCTEIWSGVASNYNFTGVAPYYPTDGSIQLNSLDEGFIYTKVNRTFSENDFDPNKPDSMESVSQVFSIRNLPTYKLSE